MKLTKQTLAAYEIHHLVKELNVLINGKINNVFQPEKNVLFFEFHIPNIGKKFMKVANGKYLYLSDKKALSVAPKGFCKSLRQHLNNSRIRKIEQLGFERIVKITLEKENIFELIIEFIPPGNILLLKDNLILTALHYPKYKDRLLRPNSDYSHPTKIYDILDITKEQLTKLLKESDKETLVKSLAIELGLGGTYAEALLKDYDKDILPKDADIDKVFKLTQDFINQKTEPTYYENEISPINYKEGGTSYTTLSEMMDSDLSVEVKKLTPLDIEIKKLNNIINSQSKTIENLDKKAQDTKIKGDKIFENYQLIQEMIKNKNHPKIVSTERNLITVDIDE